MNSKNKPTLLEEISTLCDNKSSVRARLAIAVYTGYSFPTIIEKGIMFFEYTQLVSPILIMLSFLNISDNPKLFQQTLFLARFINPSYWMSFDKTGVLENMILILVCCFTLLKQALFLYVVYCCRKPLEVPAMLGIITKILMKFQTRITYFYVSSFYINAVQVVNWESFVDVKNQNGIIKIVLFILTGFELFIALVPKIHYHYMLPTKSFLAAKTNTLEVTTLVQKILIQIFVYTLNFNVESNRWVVASVNLWIDIFRVCYFFKKLPLYSFKALEFQGGLIMFIASLNLSCVVTLVAKSIDETSGSLAFSLGIWTILALFGIVLSGMLLKKAFLRIICDPNLNSPSLLIHRIVAIKELRRLTEEHCEKNMKYDFYFLVNQTLNQHLERILWVENEKKDYANDINTKESANKMFKSFLEKLRERFPKNQFIQIFLAEFYFKTLKLYGDPIRICLQLRENGNIKIRPNAEILLIRIQEQIQSQFKTENSGFDLVSFISEHAFVAKLKLEMIKQANLQAKICSEILKESPNLGSIYEDSQKAHLCRQQNRRKINHISAVLCEFNVEALLLSAKFSLSVNHSVTDYLHYMKLYSQKLSKYQKIFHQEALCQQNSFEEKTGFLFISAAKGQEAKIVYATKSMEKVLGGDTAQYSGASFIQKSPPIFRPIYTQSWKEVSETPGNSYLGDISRCLMYHTDGYLVETDYYVDIHPFATQGFHLVFLLRTVSSNREFILVHENGEIDSVSKGMIEKLGIQPNSMTVNIRALNEEFGRANEAFNMKAFPDRYGEFGLEGSPRGAGNNVETPSGKTILSKEDADEIYVKYSNNFGCEVLLNCLDKNGINFLYNCRIQNLLIGTTLIKTFTLEENKRENREKTDHIHSASHMRTATQKEITSDTLKTDDCETARRSPLETQPPQQFTTEREIPFGEDQDELTTDRQLISPRSRKNNFDLRMSTLKRLELKNSTGLAHFSESTNERLESEDFSQRYEKGVKTILSNKNIAKLTQRKKLSTAYQASLDTQSYTKTFWGLFCIFYLTLFGLIIIRIILKMAIDSNMTSLVAKKNIFSNNSYRSYQLIETSGLARFTYQVYSGVLDMVDYGSTFSATLGYVHSNIHNIREVNKVVLQASNTLNEGAHLAVFGKNVRIYDTYFDEDVQNYNVMDSFQATDRIIETSLYLFNGFSEMSTSPEMMIRAHFLFRNSLNDLILENTILSQTMLASFDEQFDYVSNVQLSFALIFSSVLVVFAGVFFAFIGKQYSCDVYHISSVCKLNHGRIQSLRSELVGFQKSLIQEGENLNHINGEKAPVKHAKAIRHDGVTENSQNKNHLKRESLKTPEKKDLRKSFLTYIFGIIILLIILIILLTINQLWASSLLQQIQGDQERLYFSNTIRTRIALASTCVREVLATNNTALIENMKALEKLEESIKQISTLRVKAQEVFLTEEVIKENSKVKTILLGDGCSLLPSNYTYYCTLAKTNGMENGLIYLMDTYEEMMKAKMAAYVQSDKTMEALVELQAENDNFAGMVYMIVMREIDILITIMNDEFEENVQRDHDRRVNSMISVYTVIFVTGILGWVFILRKLAGSVSNFKNILRSFPAELVFSSFILKTFLMKSSKGALEQVKNEI